MTERKELYKPGKRYGVGLFVFAVFVLILVLVFSAVNNDGHGSRGPEVGSKLLPFAAPLATSKLNGDANIAKSDGSGAAGAKAACKVRGPEIVNSCELNNGKALVIAFFVDGENECTSQLNSLQKAAKENADVNFAAVAIRGDRTELKRLIAKHGWTFPVAYDRDGAIANEYAVAVCPTLVFAGSDGRVKHTTVGELSQVELAREVKKLGSSATVDSSSG